MKNFSSLIRDQDFPICTVLIGGKSNNYIFDNIELDRLMDKLKRIKENQEIKFLLASKLQKEKGILEFINASKVLKKRYPETSFYIAGEFDPTNKL